MTDRISTFVWGLAAALLVAFLIFTLGVDKLSSGIGAFFLMCLLLLAAFVAFALVLGQVRGDESLHADRTVSIGEPGPAHFLFHDLRSSPLWLVARLYVGFAWLEAGWEKISGNPSWLSSGQGLNGFWVSALKTGAGTSHPAITYGWYRNFIQFMVDNHWAAWFAKAICLGEAAVGLGLIFGVLTGWAAFFGLLMNMSFMLAGSASTNPVLFSLSILLILAWRVAGYLGGDRYILPVLGVPGLGRPASRSWGGAVQEVPQPSGD